MLALRRLAAVAALITTLLTTAASSGVAQVKAGPSKTEPASGVSARPELRAAQDALARGDRKAAARHLRGMRQATLDNAELAAQVALLQTAVVPTDLRLRRYLALAAVYPQRQEGLTALIAGLAIAEARLDGRWEEEDEEEEEEIEVEEPIEELIEEEIVEARDPDALCLSLDGALRLAAPLVETWNKRRPNDPRVLLARRLLARCRLGDAAGSIPRLVLPAAPVPVPSPLGEPIRVLVYRLENEQADLTPYLEGRPTVKPFVARTLAGDKIVPDLDPLPAGVYFVEARSLQSDWRRAQRLLVSDLRLAAQSFRGGVAVLAGLKGKPTAGVKVTVESTSRKKPFPPVSGVTDARGLVILALPSAVGKGGRNLRIGASVEQGGLHRTTLDVLQPRDDLSEAGELRGHVLAARPLYRPGETVRGRLLVRVHDGQELDGAFEADGMRPIARPLADRPVKIEAQLGKRKVTIEAVTDAWGVAPFEFPTRVSDEPGSITMRALVKRVEGDDFRYPYGHSREKKWAQLLSGERPARLDAFKTPPLLLDVKWPDFEGNAARDPVVVVEAMHPTGTPAAGLVGEVVARLGSVSDRRTFVLDTRGRAQIRFGLAALERPARNVHLRLSVTVIAADGQKVSDSIYRPWARKPKTAKKPAAARDGLVVKTSKSRVAVGQDLAVTVLGRPHETVLLSLAREVAFETRVLTLDGTGTAVTTVRPRIEWWPTVHLVATALGRGDSSGSRSWRTPNRKKLTLENPADALKVGFHPERRVYGPGDHVRFTLTTQDGDGKPTPTTVAVAVVDETLFSIARDRTVHPKSRLRPAWHDLSVFEAASAAYDSAWELLGNLLGAGRIRKAEYFGRQSNAAIGLGGGAGGAFGSRSGGRRSLNKAFGSAGLEAEEALERAEFRTVAYFSPSVVTDAEGRAVVEFELPHNLTQWRITLVAVDRGHRSAKTTVSIRTEMPLSVGLELPRLMRKGDRLDIPVTAHQIGGAPQSAKITLAVEGGAELGRDDAAVAVETAPDAGRGRSVSLRSEAEGRAVIRAELAVGEAVRDRLKRVLPLATRETRRTESASALVQGEATLTPKINPGMRRGPLRVEVLGSIDALVDRAKRYLSEYPHGCIEQTTSRLTPLLLALEAHRADGGRHPALSPAQAHRLEVGIARIRDMQQRDGGFSWWPGHGRTDPGMSAIAFRFLARMKRVGLDPEIYGISLRRAALFDRAAASFQPVGESTRVEKKQIRRKGATAPFPPDSLRVLAARPESLARFERRNALAAVEVAVTRLLLFPDARRALQTARHLAAHVTVLPTGAAARLGHALFQAGESKLAHELLVELRKRYEQAGAVSGGPGLAESPVCRAASMLELVLDLAPKDPLRSELVGAIVRRNRDGRLDHTLGTAWAVAALVRDRAVSGASRPAPGAFEVRIRGEVGGRAVTRTLRCETREDCTWHAELPAGCTRAVVSGPTDRRFLVSARVDYFEDGGAAKALARPVQISRRTHRLVPKPGTKTGFGREVIGTRVASGDLLEVELSITAPPELTYLVIECPIPAGFEAVRRPGLIIRDDRITLAVAWLPLDGRTVRRFRMVPARTGEVVWPPARTEAMYHPERRGRSAGESLEVAGPRPLPKAGVAVVLSAAHIDDARRVLQAKLDAKDEKSVLRALSDLAAFPDRRIEEWLLEVAPGRLAGAGTLRRRKVIDRYLRVLGPNVWRRIDANALPGMIELLKLDAPAACRRLGQGLESAGFGTEAQRRFRDRRFASALEARLLGEVVLARGRFEGDPWRQLEAGLSFFDAADQIDAAVRTEVRADRLARASARRETRWAHLDGPFASLVAAPFRNACRALWTVGGSRWSPIGVGNRETPERIATLRAVLDRIVAPAVNAGPARVRALAGPLNSILAQAAWPPRGSAEPAGHRAIRARLTEIFAAARNACIAELGALLTDRVADLREMWKLARNPMFATPAERANTVRTALRLMLHRARTEDLVTAKTAQRLAREILSTCSPDGLEAETIRPEALEILGRGPRKLAGAAWSVLDQTDRRAIPTIVLLGLYRPQESNRWILEAVLERGFGAQAALLRKHPLPDYDSDRTWIARHFDEKALATLSLDHLLEYAARFAPFSRDEAARRLLKQIAAGPWSGAELAERLARPGDYRKRTMLLEACAARGVAPERWDEKDPLFQRYSILLGARSGDTTALATVRAWLRNTQMPRRERPALVWALGRSARVADLMCAGTGDNVRPYWPDVLARATPEEVKATWKYRKHRWSKADQHTVLEMLPADLAGRMLEEAFDTWRNEKGYWMVPLFRRAPSERLIPLLLTAAPRLDFGQVDVLLAEFKGRADVLLPLAYRLRDHGSPFVRKRAARTIYRITGEAQAWRDEDGAEHRAGPETASAYLGAIRKRAARGGLGAIEKALGEADARTREAAVEFLSRKGMYLD